ncbi:hypothetical protein [Micromonospora sp. SL4-19]|uniref:hypothetical protein n=1 Tax=Micromonospora sp. SL4-19 TaxID=3399129 RepID=UPI003A4E0924
MLSRICAKLRPAIVVLMSAQGQPAPDIDHRRVAGVGSRLAALVRSARPGRCLPLSANRQRPAG